MQIIERRETPTLSVRYRTSVAELPNSMGPIYGEIVGHMTRKEIAFAGAPFAAYYNMDMNDLDVEIGFPVASPVEGAGRVTAGTLPGGTYATAKHTGPYTTIEATYNALMAFVAEKGLQPTTSFMFEEYLNSPEDTPPERLETVIYFPIATVHSAG